MMSRTTLDLWVGFFVTIGCAALLFLALKVGNLSGAQIGETYSIQAKFDNIGGLKVRAPVRSAGVTVGRVTSITLDPATFEGVVTLSVDSRVRFPRDSAAQILTAGLLGDQFIGIVPGGDEAELQPGGRIVQTQGAVVLEDLIGRFLFNRAADAASPAAGAATP